MDLGMGLFFFLFNLYLTDLKFDERAIGHITASLTLGGVAGTIPAMFLAREKGLRSLLLISFICSPLVCLARVLVLSWPAQIGLAFATGAFLCGWPICFSPAVASLTDQHNRSRGFSLAFAAGIGLGTVAGVAGGYAPQLLHSSSAHFPLVSGIRMVLIASCIITFVGVIPLSILKIDADYNVSLGKVRIFHPFLIRFLPAYLIWTVVTGSFPVFGAIYLQKLLGIPLGRLGAVFSLTRLAEFCAVLLVPTLFRLLGLVKGIAIVQMCTSILLFFLAGSKGMLVAVCFYMLYSATQFMCGPGIYSLLMNNIPEAERSTASALQNLTGSLCQAATAALTGIGIVRFGYNNVVLINAAIALGAAILFLQLRGAAIEPEARNAKPLTWDCETDPLNLRNAEGLQ